MSDARVPAGGHAIPKACDGDHRAAVADAFARVREQHRALAGTAIAGLVNGDPARFADFAVTMEDVLYDFSKTKLDREAKARLIELAETADLPGYVAAMFAGAPVNVTEGRAAGHLALRRDPDGIRAGGDRERVLAFADGVRAGHITGAGGDAITDVVHIGIGGSHRGPAMALRALARFHDGPRVHFLANACGTDLTDILGTCVPEQTLVIVCSKTFTTRETMMNARSVRRWLAGALGGEGARAHLAAVTADPGAAAAFGVPEERVFPMPGDVSGRYAIWGAVGLPVMLALGSQRFRAFLRGGAAMDAHLRTAPIARNLPMMLALVGVWHVSARGHGTRAILPYHQRLAAFPDYVQQMDMESNGKTTHVDGVSPAHDSAPVVWGDVGTSAQHSFFQMLHQGARQAPCEFLVTAEAEPRDAGEHRDMRLANCLAQARALMIGRDHAATVAALQGEGMTREAAEALAPHRTFPGDRPSTVLVFGELEPYSLGRLMALYEHRAILEGALWGVNPFDQWGVEIGKGLADSLSSAVRDGLDGADPSTHGLLAWCRAVKRGGEGS